MLGGRSEKSLCGNIRIDRDRRVSLFEFVLKYLDIPFTSASAESRIALVNLALYLPAFFCSVFYRAVENDTKAFAMT